MLFRFLLPEVLALKVRFLNGKAIFGENDIVFKVKPTVELKKFLQGFIEVHPRAQQIFKAPVLFVELNRPS